jgi:hypothetical protein
VILGIVTHRDETGRSAPGIGGHRLQCSKQLARRCSATRPRGAPAAIGGPSETPAGAAGSRAALDRQRQIGSGHTGSDGTPAGRAPRIGAASHTIET